MKKILLSTLVASTLLFAAEYKYEVSPMIGYIDTQNNVDLEDHKVYGLAGYKNMADESMIDQLEIALFRATGVEYDNSTLDTAINLFSVNGIKEFALNETFKLYALAGAGYEQIKNSQFGNDSDPFANYGVGFKAKLSDLVSLKLDARHLLKFDGDQNILYTAGLVLAFGEKTQKQPPLEAVKPTPVMNYQSQEEPQEIEEKQPKEEPPVVMNYQSQEEAIIKDDDNDGVINSQDLCPNTATGIKVNSDGCEVMVEAVNIEVLFGFDSAKIRSYSIDKIEKLVEQSKTIDNFKILLEGHTDSIGTKEYNQQLSERRALSAKEQLVSMGIPEDTITTRGYGETRPQVPNTTPKNRQLNRRVEATIVK